MTCDECGVMCDEWGVTLFPGHDILEQLCINFTNERLAKGFVDVVFKREQAEYLSEGVPWEPIVYVNFI